MALVTNIVHIMSINSESARSGNYSNKYNTLQPEALQPEAIQPESIQNSITKNIS